MDEEALCVAFFESEFEALTELMTNPTVQVAVCPEMFQGQKWQKLICRYDFIREKLTDSLILSQRGREAHHGDTVFQSLRFRNNKEKLAEVLLELGMEILVPVES